ncbi:MAG: type II toxin-antitoxin system RelE/ParE family toxin, partial [Nitrospira sp.]|nr:type II toxin-antitoxin system RelE/ParE family toxin [Nitrospira sp.]
GQPRPNNGCAISTVEAIYQKAELLREFPESGYRYWQRSDRHIRILLHGHYRIAYLIMNVGTIHILGVFHGALNIDRYLL